MATHPTPTVVALTREADADRLLAVDNAAFFADPDEIDQHRFLDHFEFDRTFGAEREGEDGLVGLYSSYSLEVTVPGPGRELRRLPMSGLTWVSVHPDHRRTGVLGQMLRHHFDWMHERGETLGGLHAAEVGIYGRFGYGSASLDVTLKTGRGAVLVAPELDDAAGQVRTRFTKIAGEGVPEQIHELHRRLAADELGAVTRTDLQARFWMRDNPEFRRGREPNQVMFAEVDGRRRGYVLFHRKLDWERGNPKGEVTAYELYAENPAVMLALARRMLDFDLTTTVSFRNRRLDDPLIWWTGGPRTMQVEVLDALWLRLVDVPRALMDRGYAAPCDVVLDVTDEHCPWNEGRWRLVVDASGVATCEATDAEAQLRVPVRALGGAYLGSRSLVSEAAAGFVVAQDTDALYAVSRAFRTEREPVGALMF